MAERLPSWRGVAGRLAARMQNHAYCDAHRENEPDVGNCPFCADREAYRLWQRKVAEVRGHEQNTGGTGTR